MNNPAFFHNRSPDGIPVSRRERERLVRRRLIVDAAMSVFALKGFGATKLDDVAERAEFGKATLYGYFPTKEVLFAAVVEEAFAEILEIAEKAFAGKGAFEERLETFVRSELRHFFERPESFPLMMRESHHLQNANPLFRLMPELLDVIVRAIAAEQKKGRLVKGPEPIDLATLLVNMLFGQFMSRTFRCIAREGTDWSNDPDGVRAFIQGIKSDDPEREIDRTTTLIVGVFLDGARRSAR